MFKGNWKQAFEGFVPVPQDTSDVVKPFFAGTVTRLDVPLGLGTDGTKEFMEANSDPTIVLEEIMKNVLYRGCTTLAMIFLLLLWIGFLKVRVCLRVSTWLYFVS